MNAFNQESADVDGEEENVDGDEAPSDVMPPLEEGAGADKRSYVEKQVSALQPAHHRQWRGFLQLVQGLKPASAADWAFVRLQMHQSLKKCKP